MNIEEAKEQLISLKENAKANIDTDEIFKLDYEAIETVLSELEKKDAKIERLKTARDNWKKTFQQSLADEKKKDKVINEMATYIIRNVSREKTEKLTGLKDKEVIWSYDIKEYFTNKVERGGK